MNSEFPPTRLTIIEQIRSGSDDDRKAALELFIESYRPALVSFLVKCKRVPEDQAEDLVQDFIIKKVLSGKILNHDEGKGRFRNLLRVALQREFLNELKKQKREQATDQLDQIVEPPSETEDFIDQAWAVAVFSSALSRLKAEYEHWGLFVDRVLTQPPLPYAEIIEKYGYESPEKASNLLMTIKRAFNRTLTECVKDQSSWTNGAEDKELAVEVDFLRASLADPSLLREAIRASRISNSSVTASRSRSDPSISDSMHAFVDETTDTNWNSEDNLALLEHLLRQPLSQFIDTPEQTTLGDFLIDVHPDSKSLSVNKRLKNLFNQRGKTGNSPLPNRIDVTVTFATIAKHVASGHEISDITSTDPRSLLSRLEMLLEKDWIPSPLISLFQKASVEILK